MVRTLSTSSDFAVDPRRDVGKAADSEIGVPSSRRDFRSSLPVAPNPNLPGREEGAMISYLDNYYLQQNQQRAELELKMVTEDGVPIDFTALERGGDDAFTEESNRRTAGMESRDQLFRSIEGLGGEWLNRKRMCVDAGEFIDVLPAGWKVTVAIKPSRQGRSVPYFYRYIRSAECGCSPWEDGGDGNDGVNSTSPLPHILQPEMHGEEILVGGGQINPAGGVQIHDRLTSYNRARGDPFKAQSQMVLPLPLKLLLRAAIPTMEKDRRGAKVRLRPRAYSRVGNLRLLSEILMRDEGEDLANLRLLSEVSERFPAMNSFLRARRLQSCKEVARFLQSQFLSRPTAQNYSHCHIYCTRDARGRDSAGGTDNPVGGVQIHDKYYCDICRIGFNERPEFARHRRFHRKTRSGGYRNRPPLTDGMIMKDGKYGCQFCPRVFDRLTSYTGHVRIHLRRNLKCSSTSIEAAPRAAHTYYGKDRRGARVRLRPRAYSRVDNLRLLSEISIRDKEEELANLRLLSEVSERLI
nr:uncharacterized protein LOC105631583 isoform X2 [Ipomoea batatas]